MLEAESSVISPRVDSLRYVLHITKAPNGLNRWFEGPNRFKLRLYKWLVVDLKAKRFKPLTNDLTTGL